MNLDGVTERLHDGYRLLSRCEDEIAGRALDVYHSVF